MKVFRKEKREKNKILAGLFVFQHRSIMIINITFAPQIKPTSN